MTGLIIIFGYPGHDSKEESKLLIDCMSIIINAKSCKFVLRVKRQHVSEFLRMRIK